jgi:hypothetical protein
MEIVFEMFIVYIECLVLLFKYFVYIFVFRSVAFVIALFLFLRLITMILFEMLVKNYLKLFLLLAYNC